MYYMDSLPSVIYYLMKPCLHDLVFCINLASSSGMCLYCRIEHYFSSLKFLIYRSRPASGASGVGKLDSASQHPGLGMRPLARNDQDNNSLPNDRGERLDKEGANLKAVNK